MQLSRRGLFGGMLALVAAPAIVRVESLMQLPMPKQIIFPETVDLLCNLSGFQVGDVVSIDGCNAISLWKNSNEFIKAIDHQYDQEFAVNNARVGSQLRIRYPADFKVVTRDARKMLSVGPDHQSSSFIEFSRKAAA